MTSGLPKKISDIMRQKTIYDTLLEDQSTSDETLKDVNNEDNMVKIAKSKTVFDVLVSLVADNQVNHFVYVFSK